MLMREISVRAAVLIAGIGGMFIGAVCASGCGSPTPKVKAEVENVSIIQRPDEIEIKNIVGIEKTTYSYSVYTYDQANKKMQRYQLTATSTADEIVICDVEKGAPMWAKQYHKRDGATRHHFELHVSSPADILEAKHR
jgi:hypothetical protein